MFKNVPHVKKIVARMQVNHLLSVNRLGIIWSSFLFLTLNKFLRKPVLVTKYLFHLICSARNYMFKVNNRDTRTSREICSKLTIKAPEQRHWRRCDVFIVNFEHISHLVLVFLLLTLNM